MGGWWQVNWVTSNVFYNSNRILQMPHKVNIQSPVLLFNKEEVNDGWMLTVGLPACLNTGQQQYNSLKELRPATPITKKSCGQQHKNLQKHCPETLIWLNCTEELWPATQDTLHWAATRNKDVGKLWKISRYFNWTLRLITTKLTRQITQKLSKLSSGKNFQIISWLF